MGPGDPSCPRPSKFAQWWPGSRPQPSPLAGCLHRRPPQGPYPHIPASRSCACLLGPGAAARNGSAMVFSPPTSKRPVCPIGIAPWAGADLLPFSYWAPGVGWQGAKLFGRKARARWVRWPVRPLGMILSAARPQPGCGHCGLAGWYRQAGIKEKRAVCSALSLPLGGHCARSRAGLVRLRPM